MSYSDKLKDPRWQRRRLKIMERDNWTCQLCESKDEQLQVHHKEYVKGMDPWEYPDDLLITLCENCHKHVSGKFFVPTIKDITELSTNEIRDGIQERISRQYINDVLNSLKAGRYN